VKPSRPSARLTLDGRAWSAAEAGLVWLRAWIGLGAAHAALSLAAWPGSPFAAAAAGATLSVALGEADAEEDVWSGEVTEVGATAIGVHVDGLAATQALNRERRTRSYLRQSVADIVRDLAGSVPIDEVEAPLRLESYAVDDRRPVWEHLLDLAALAGCDLSAAASGGLRFVPVKAGGAGPLPVALPGASALRYGANVLSFRIAKRSAGTPLAAAAYGAASEKGAERWHWLRHDPVPSPDATAPARVRGALRTREGVQAATQGSTARAGRAGVRGEIVALGRPGVRPGDVVEVQELPGVEGPLRVLSIEHGFDARSGFLTRLAVEGTGGAGDVSALAGGLGL
jgi:hypothetical protein